MSSKFLSGITHAIVSVPTREDSEVSGIRASVAFCYGPGDDTAIANVLYTKGVDGLVWTVPHVDVVVGGRWVKSPVFRGTFLDVLCQAAARALERVKESVGAPNWGTSYRVYTGISKVEEVEA